MSRRANIISNVLSLGLTLLSLFFVVYFTNQNYYVEKMINVMLWFVLGAILCGLLNAFLHELGHVIAGKNNGYAFSAMTVWFFKWTKKKKKIVFSLTLPFDEAGYTEMIPTKTDKVAERHVKYTQGGVYGSIILLLLGIPAFFLLEYLSWQLFVLWAMLVPMSVYYLAGNVLPMSSSGALNDGAVVYGFKKKNFGSMVTTALLIYQAELYNGKTPSQVDDKLLFDLPQLSEEDPLFVMLLNARYNYFVDKGDFDGAKSVSDRLMGIVDNFPKYYKNIIKVDALYNACTFDYNEELADDLVYELEKYLNNVNTVTNVRAKLAYILYVSKETSNVDMFYEKAIKEARRCKIKGLGEFEIKLLENMKKDFPVNE